MDEASIRQALEQQGRVRHVPMARNGSVDLEVEQKQKGWVVSGAQSYVEDGISCHRAFSVRNTEAFPSSKSFPTRDAAIKAALQELYIRTGCWASLKTTA